MLKRFNLAIDLSKKALSSRPWLEQGAEEKLVWMGNRHVE
jgi:hypothetical protein